MAAISKAPTLDQLLVIVQGGSAERSDKNQVSLLDEMYDLYFAFDRNDLAGTVAKIGLWILSAVSLCTLPALIVGVKAIKRCCFTEI
jgi:hypothetical protein